MGVEQPAAITLYGLVLEITEAVTQCHSTLDELHNMPLASPAPVEETLGAALGEVLKKVRNLSDRLTDLHTHVGRI